MKINQNLRQQVLVPQELAEEHEPAPFVEPGDTPATIAYRCEGQLAAAKLHTLRNKLNPKP